MERRESLLCGGYEILQDPENYCFTSDSVLLSRFLSAKKKERVADFCAGSGIVGLHFFAENKNVEKVVLFEMQEALANMSARTIAMNGLGDKIFVENLRLQDIPASYTEYFSLILCNPPYEKDGFQSANEGKAVSKKELFLTLEETVSAAKRCLKFGGRFALVHRADRAAEVIFALKSEGLEPKKLQFVAGKAGAKPYAVLLAAVKGGKAGLDVSPTLVNAK